MHVHAAHVRARVKLERRKRAPGVVHFGPGAKFIPSDFAREKQSNEHSARFVGSYATGPVGSVHPKDRKRTRACHRHARAHARGRAQCARAWPGFVCDSRRSLNTAVANTADWSAPGSDSVLSADEKMTDATIAWRIQSESASELLFLPSYVSLCIFPLYFSNR